MLKKSFLLSAPLFLSLSAWSHSYWVDERASQLAIILGESGEDMRYDADVVAEVQGFDGQKQPVSVKLVPTPNNVLLEDTDGVHTLVSLFRPAHYSQDSDGKWHAKPKNEVEKAVKATAYVNSNITLLDYQAKLVPNEKLALQILPLANPFKLKIGDKLPVRVYFEGKPLANAEIIPDYTNNLDKTLKTDKYGKAFITLKSAGMTVINVHHEVENTDKTLADKTYYNSTLSFNIFNQKKHEQ